MTCARKRAKIEIDVGATERWLFLFLDQPHQLDSVQVHLVQIKRQRLGFDKRVAVGCFAGADGVRQSSALGRDPITIDVHADKSGRVGRFDTSWLIGNQCVKRVDLVHDALWHDDGAHLSTSFPDIGLWPSSHSRCCIRSWPIWQNGLRCSRQSGLTPGRCFRWFESLSLLKVHLYL